MVYSIALHAANYDWLFGTLPFGLFWSNLDTRDLETYPRTYSGHFWNMSHFEFLLKKFLNFCRNGYFEFWPINLQKGVKMCNSVECCFGCPVSDLWSIFLLKKFLNFCTNRYFEFLPINLQKGVKMCNTVEWVCFWLPSFWLMTN